MKRRTFLLGALLPAAAVARRAAAAEAEILIRDARLVPVSGPVVERGSLLLRGGRIAALGANVPVPAGARVIDGSGLSAYPGMIEADTRLGLSEISSVRATVDSVELGDLNPQLCAFEAFHPHSELIAVTRANGVTTVLSRPSGGTVPGQAALMNLAGWTAEEMAARPRAGLVVRYPRVASISVPPGLKPVVSDSNPQLTALKALFRKAGEYQGPKPGEPADLKLQALQPYVKGELPVIFEVDREAEIRGAIALAEELKLRYILSGLLEADKVTKLLKEKQAKCLLGSILTQPSGTREAYDRLYTLPATLHAAGIPFALVSGETANARNLPYHAAMAVAYGLPADAALRSVTLAPAEILGVEKDYGSLRVGKVGNLFLATGDPFDARTQVKHLFIQGRAVDLDNRHEALYRKFLQRLEPRN